MNFSRASLATVTDADGKIKWAPHNLLTNSESFDASAWGKYLTTVTSNSTVAPNGTTTADTIATTSTNATIYQTSSIPVGTSTFSCWLKAGTLTAVTLIYDGGSSTGRQATFTLTGSGSASAVTNLSSGGGTFSGGTASITPLADGWYLCTISNVTTTAAGSLTLLLATSGNVIAWGAHLYRSDLGGMVANTSAYPMYNPTTPKNLLGYTESFDNAAWIKGNLAATPVIANAIIAPNGLQNADKIVENSSSAAHFIYQNYTVISGTPYTFAIYAKAAERQFLTFNSSSATFGDFVFATFNLTSGTVTEVGSSSTASISSVGDGWYRCSVRATPFAGGSAPIVWGMATTATPGRTPTYTGDGTSGIYLWGAQLSDSASLDAYSANAFAAPTAAAYHAPRLDYGADGVAKGLLVEEQRTNLLLRSDAFDNASWGKTNVTVTANTAVSPAGVSDADKIVADSTSGIHTVGLLVTPVVGTYTASAYVKADGYGFCALQMLFGGLNIFRAYNLTTGAITASAGTGTDATPVNAGNGWWRFAVTFTTLSTATDAFRVRVENDGTGANWSGNGTSGVLVWGAQLEAGSFATSYIPTTSASVTRSADVAQVGTSAFPYNAAEGTIVVGWTAGNVVSTASTLFYFDDVDGTQYQNVMASSQSNGATASAGIRYTVRNNSVDQANITTTTPTLVAGTSYKMAAVYASNDFAVCINAGTVGTDTSGTVPTGIDTLRIASHRDSTYLNGWIRQITYIPRRLTNAELQARTA